MTGKILPYIIKISPSIRANCAPVRMVGCTFIRSLRTSCFLEIGTAGCQQFPNLTSPSPFYNPNKISIIIPNKITEFPILPIHENKKKISSSSKLRIPRYKPQPERNTATIPRTPISSPPSPLF